MVHHYFSAMELYKVIDDVAYAEKQGNKAWLDAFNFLIDNNLLTLKSDPERHGFIFIL